MSRATNFGIGITLMLIGLSIAWWIHSMDPGDNTVPAMLMGCVMICPGAILLGKAIWPEDKKRD
jgi:hypothetical protein